MNKRSEMNFFCGNLKKLLLNCFQKQEIHVNVALVCKDVAPL